MPWCASILCFLNMFFIPLHSSAIKIIVAFKMLPSCPFYRCVCTFSALSPTSLILSSLIGLQKKVVEIREQLRRIAQRIGIALKSCEGDMLVSFSAHSP